MCPSTEGGKQDVLVLLTALWSTKASIFHVYEEQTCRFQRVEEQTMDAKL